MNGRLFAKRWVAVMLLLFGFVGWMVSVSDGREGGFPLFVVTVVLAALLFRRTRRDDEWMRKYEKGELPGQAVESRIGDMVAERASKPPDPQKRLKRMLVGVFVLNVLTFPFRVLWDLMKQNDK